MIGLGRLLSLWVLKCVIGGDAVRVRSCLCKVVALCR